MATIFTRWISRRKERRAKKAAVVRGEALTSVGVTSSTPRTTTGGYATSSGEVHVSSGGNITYSGGGGGSSGGGGGSSTQTTTTTQTATPTTSTSQLLTSSQQSALKKVTTQQDLLNRNKIYNPYTNTYQTSAYGNYDDSTAISRIPSINEQIKIDEANKKGDVGYQITGYSTQDYRDLANQQNKIVSYSEKISIVKKDLDKELNRFNTDWKGYIKNNEFVGNQKEYQIYKESYNKLNRDINKYNTKLAKLKGNLNLYSLSGGSISKEGYLEMPKVNIGGVKVKGKQILKGKNVSLNKFRGLYTGGTGSQIVSTVKALSKTGSVIAGESIGKGLGEKKKYVIAKSKLIPEKTIKGIYQPQFGTATNYDKYGNAIPKYKNVKVKAHKTPELYFTGAQAGESIGNVLNVAGQAGLVLGSYELAGSFVPRGGEILFAGQAAGEVNKAGGVKQFVKEHPAQAALTGAVVLGGGLFAGSKALKGLEAGKVSKQLEKLSNRPVKYFEFVNEPSSQMYLRGFQEYGGLKREINVVGRLAKTEKGFKLIPEARGYSTTYGEVKGLTKKKGFFGFDTFKIGSKGKTIPYGNIGDIKMYKQLGISTYEPRGSTYALFKKGTEFSEIEKRFGKNVNLRGDVVKDIYSRNLFGLNRNVYLGLKKNKEIGLTFIKRKVPKVESHVVKPANIKKTPLSKTFQLEAKPILDLGILKKGLSKQQEVSLKTKNTLGFKPISVSQSTQQTQEIKPTQLNQVNQLSYVKIKQEQKTNQVSGTSTILKNVITPKEEEQLKEILNTKVNQKSLQESKQKSKLNQLFKQTQILKQEQIQAQRLFQKQSFEFKPIIPFPRITLKGAIKRVKTIAKTRPEVFEVFGKRFGKNIELGKYQSKEQAEKRLKKFLKETLGASGFLKESGKKLKASELNLLKDIEFRKSKLSPYVIIEKKHKRLRKSGTGKQIQYFRSNPKKGRKKGKSLFGI